MERVPKKIFEEILYSVLLPCNFTDKFHYFFLPVFIKNANIPPNQKYYGCSVVMKVSRSV
jgi:hypothetical protein